MLNRAARKTGRHDWRNWPTLSIVGAGAALFLALGGSAVAATNLIHARDIAAGAVTSQAIKNSDVRLMDLSPRAQASLQGDTGLTGDTGDTGAPGAAGTNGANGASGAAGATGTNGVPGTAGTNGAPGAAGTNGAPGAVGAAGAAGTNGANGANGPNGANGVDGIDGIDGTDGTDGTNGTDGIDGTIQPLWTQAGVTALPTSTQSTVVLNMAVPAGNYVVFAKTQLSHTGAGDSIDCQLKEGNNNIDQIAMKTMPALAALPASLQAVVTIDSASHFSLECHVATANGSAAFNSLIAIPTG
jgi:hypothetical protein